MTVSYNVIGAGKALVYKSSGLSTQMNNMAMKSRIPNRVLTCDVLVKCKAQNLQPYKHRYNLTPIDT